MIKAKSLTAVEIATNPLSVIEANSLAAVEIVTYPLSMIKAKSLTAVEIVTYPQTPLSMIEAICRSLQQRLQLE